MLTIQHPDPEVPGLLVVLQQVSVPQHVVVEAARRLQPYPLLVVLFRGQEEAVFFCCWYKMVLNCLSDRFTKLFEIFGWL